MLESHAIPTVKKLLQSYLSAYGIKSGGRGVASVRGQSPKPLTPTLSPLKRGEGVLRRRARRNLSGRGINLFKLLRRNLRASDGGGAGRSLPPPRA